jgi:restriction system protein
MAVPGFEGFMLPILKIAADGQEHRVRDVRDALADQFRLSPEDRTQLLPSGADKLLNNRVGWAVSFLKHALLIEAPRRGHFQITPRGKEVLSKTPTEITSKFLMQFPEFANWGTTPSDEGQEQVTSSNEPIQQLSITPQEQMENGYAKLKRDLEGELLAKVKACSPEFFEEVVVRLLVAMGYGGSASEARRIGRGGDGGVDGVIKEDRLGLEQIYVQAKRWDSTSVQRPEVQAFVGALAGKKSRRGVFITTSAFTKGAQEYAQSIDTAKVVLMDGPKLAEYMVEYGIGVATVRQFEIKAIDHDFFEDDEESSVAAKSAGHS